MKQKTLRDFNGEAYPMDAQKAITEKHKVEDGVSVTFKAKGFNWRIVKLHGNY